MLISATTAVIQNGRRGLKRSHNCAPSHGAGSEIFSE